MRYSKLLILLAYIFTPWSFFAQASDTLSSDNDESFALYLFNSELYQYASQEFEKLLFKDPNNIDHLKKLITCYKKNDDFDMLENRLAQFDIKDEKVLIEYYNLLLLEKRTESLVLSLNQKANLLSQEDLEKLQFKMALVDMDWEKSKALYPNTNLVEYEGIMNKIEEAKFKSPVTAAILSGIIPGTGRYYAKDYWDGAISTLFVISTGIQSYRRFKENGITAVGGWIYGGIGLGFYISNIYGSYQSAKYYNQKLNEEIRQEALLIMANNN